MADTLSDQEIDFKELVISSTIEIHAISQLLVEKEIITQHEYAEKLKQVYLEFQGGP